MFVGTINKTVLSATSFSLVWDEQSNSTYYILKVDEVISGRTWQFFVVENHATILSLHPYYEYKCTVMISFNAHHLCNITEEITVVTKEAGKD